MTVLLRSVMATVHHDAHYNVGRSTCAAQSTVSHQDMDINDNKAPEVFKSYDDGYIVRGMTQDDARIVQEWFAGMAIIGPDDLDVALRSFPAGRGFYIGELDGVVVSSCVRLPWGGGAYYGAYYYVHKDYRGKGYGTKLRDQVAYGHVKEAGGKLCIDAVGGSVAEKNIAKFGYVHGWTTRIYCYDVKEEKVEFDGKIMPATDVPFDDLIAFDNTHFVSKDYLPRRKFLAEWIRAPKTAAVVAVNKAGGIVGFGQRRAALASQPNNHLIGPLYAENVDIARAISHHLGNGVVGDKMTTNIWVRNDEAVKLVESFNGKAMLEVYRMHANGDPEEYKPTVFAITNLDTCGF